MKWNLSAGLERRARWNTVRDMVSVLSAREDGKVWIDGVEFHSRRGDLEVTASGVPNDLVRGPDVVNLWSFTETKARALLDCMDILSGRRAGSVAFSGAYELAGDDSARRVSERGSFATAGITHEMGVCSNQDLVEREVVVLSCQNRSHS